MNSFLENVPSYPTNKYDILIFIIFLIKSNIFEYDSINLFNSPIIYTKKIQKDFEKERKKVTSSLIRMKLNQEFLNLMNALI